MSDDVSLLAGGRSIAGWTSVRVTRRAEGCPNDFDLALTELYPGETTDLVIQQGDTAQVMIGSDLVITGYADRLQPRISKEEHIIGVSGRGKCQDLVDCSAEWANGQISGASALGIAQKLAEPYGISVSSDVDDMPAIPQFNLMYGETAFEIIERICRYSALLVYELPDGSLYLTQAGDGQAATGAVERQNVEEASAMYSMDARYSTYEVMRQSMDVLGDVGAGGNLLALTTDPGVTRHRKLCLVAESGGGAGQDVAVRRGIWEAARRAGRSNQIRVVVDSWRDGAGALWEPNTIIPLQLPTLKLPSYTWVISEVTYRYDAAGTRAELIVLPKAAFQPQPVLLQPFAPDVPAGIAGN